MDVRSFIDHRLTRIGVGGGLGLVVALLVNVFIIGDPFKDSPVNVGFFVFWGVNIVGVLGGMYIARKRQ